MVCIQKQPVLYMIPFIFMRVMTIPDEFQGYCDVFLKCRKVDAEGPLVRLKNLLLNEKTLLTIAQWVTEFWWAVLLMGIAFVIFMACFIRCFAIHTPSSNPRLPKNLHFTETLRRPARALKQQVYETNLSNEKEFTYYWCCQLLELNQVTSIHSTSISRKKTA